MLIRLLREQLRPYRRWLSLVVLFQLIGVVANLYLPTLNAEIIDSGVTQGDIGKIWSSGAMMLAVSILAGLCSIGATYYAARAGTGFGRNTRAALFARVGSFSARELREFGAPSLITRTTNDVQQVQTLVVMALTLMVSAPIMAIGGIVMALRENVALSWLLLVAVPVLAVALGLVIWKMIPGFRLMQTRLDTVNRVLREQLTGIRVVRAFGREPYETQRFDRANSELTDAGISVMRLMAIMFPVVLAVMNVSTVAVWWFGAHKIADSEIQIGSLTAYMTYLIQILMAVMMATFMFMMIPRASVSAERIAQVLDTESSVTPPVDPVLEADLPGAALRGAIEFDDVTLTYPGAEAPVLKHISFAAPAGGTVAIIGSTGSGKSTLVSLIARLFDPTAGAVRIDGVNIDRLDPALLYANLGLVPQQGYLFTGTVASNLRYGNPDATDAELEAALEIAQAAGFVAALGGLDAAIAQGGSNVSGGQRQRLCIARALVARPRILIFDDSFSALDVATDARLRAALREQIVDTTMVIVAQRVSTIASVPMIVVLEAGEIVGTGTHAELLESCPTYREIAASQAQLEGAR